MRPRLRPSFADRPGPVDRYGVLLALLGAVFLLSSLRGGEPWARATGGALVALVAVQTLRVSAAPRRLVVAASCAGLLAALLAGVGAVARDVPDWIPTAIVALMLVATPGAVLARILRHRVVSLQTILGAVCVYVLLALVFSTVLATVDAATRFDALDPPASEFRDDYLYVSVITLTTVGFGDVVAASQGARTILMVEALAGQIFLVTLVARLVSLYGTAPRNPRATRVPEGTIANPD